MKRVSWMLGIGMLAVCLALTGCEKKPAANFSADVTSGTAPLTVQFTDLETGAMTHSTVKCGAAFNVTVPLQTNGAISSK